MLLLRLRPPVTAASRWLLLPVPVLPPMRALALASRAVADMLFLVLLPGAELLVPSIPLPFLLMSKRCVRSNEEDEGVDACCKCAEAGGGVVAILAFCFEADAVVAADEDDAAGVNDGAIDSEAPVDAGSAAEDGPAIEPTPSLLASEAIVNCELYCDCRREAVLTLAVRSESDSYRQRLDVSPGDARG